MSLFHKWAGVSPAAGEHGDGCHGDDCCSTGVSSAVFPLFPV